MSGTLTVFYETDGDSGLQVPSWVLLHGIRDADWDATLYVRLDAPFEACSCEELDDDTLAVTVPDHVYVRHKHDPGVIGLHLPSLLDYVNRYAAVSEHPFSYKDIDRLLLRISDIEDLLQYDVQVLLPWRTNRVDTSFY